jgi:hypothetical protein
MYLEEDELIAQLPKASYKPCSCLECRKKKGGAAKSKPTADDDRDNQPSSVEKWLSSTRKRRMEDY